METLPRIDRAFLAQFLGSVFGCAHEVLAYRVLRRAEDYAVLAVTLDQPEQELILKLAGPRAALRPAFARSAAIARRVRTESTVRTFEVLAVDESCRRWPWQYLITSSLPGETWQEYRARTTAADAQSLFTALGEAVGQLHTIVFPACGEINVSGEVEGTTDYYAALQARARRRIARPAHVELFLSVLQIHRALFADIHTGVLCHEDLNPSNLLVRETPAGQVELMVIDFDSAWAGCAETDLARLEFWRGMLGPGFWYAYQAYAPVSATYSQRRPLYQLLWCLEYARSTPQHVHDTASVCSQLHLDPVIF